MKTKNPWEKIHKGVRSGEKFIVAEADRPYIEEFTYAENKKIYPIVKEYMKQLNAELDKK